MSSPKVKKIERESAMTWYRDNKPKQFFKWSKMLWKWYKKRDYKVGRDALIRILKDNEKGEIPSSRFVGDWIKQFQTNQIFAPTRKARTIQSFAASYPNATLQADTAFVLNKTFKGFKDQPPGMSNKDWKEIQDMLRQDLRADGYTLGKDPAGMIVMIDVATRKIYARAVLDGKSKTTAMVILGTADGRYKDPIDGQMKDGMRKEAEDFWSDRGFSLEKKREEYMNKEGKRKFWTAPGVRIGKLVTDKGSEFLGEKLVGAFEDLRRTHPDHYKKTFSFEGKSQANGLVERANKTLKYIIRKAMPTNDKGSINYINWHKYLPKAVEIYNSSVHSTIKMPPDKISFDWNSKYYYRKALRNIAEKSRRAEDTTNPLSEGDFVRVKNYNQSKKYNYPNYSSRNGPLLEMVDDLDASAPTSATDGTIDWRGVYLVNKVYAQRETKAETYGVVGKWFQPGMTEKHTKRVDTVDTANHLFSGVDYPAEYKERKFTIEELYKLPTRRVNIHDYTDKGDMRKGVRLPLIQSDVKSVERKADTGRTRGKTYDKSTKPSKPTIQTKKPKKDKEDKEEQYVVERIVAYKKKGKKVKVRWEGYSEAHDTWEPAGQFRGTEVWKEFWRTGRKKS